MADVTIPHVHLTSDMMWDPTKYDSAASEADDSVQAYHNKSDNATADYDCDRFMADLEKYVEHNYGDVMTDIEALMHDEFYEHGEDFDGHENSGFSEPIAVPNVLAAVAVMCRKVEAKLTHVEHKYGKTLEELRPHFAWASTERIKATIDASTQLYRATQWAKKIKRHFRSRFPGANVERIHETVCTDTAFMEVKGAADGITGHGGAIGFQLYVGHDTRHMTVYPVQTDGEFPKTLEDYIRMHGAPAKLYSDNAKAELSNKTKAILRNLVLPMRAASRTTKTKTQPNMKFKTLRKILSC